MRAIALAAAAISVVIVIGSDPFFRNLRRLNAAEPTRHAPSATETAPLQTPADSGGKPVEHEIDQRAKQVLDKSAKNLLLIESIEFRAELVPAVALAADRRNPMKNVPPRVLCSYLFRCDGDKWRVDEIMGTATEPESYSFNGESFQFLSAKLSAFRESKHRMGSRPQCPFRSPIGYAYFWAFPRDGFVSWEELRDRDNWSAIAKRAKYVGETSSKSQSIVTLEVERVSTGGKAFLYLVDFDKEHSCVPVAWSSCSLPDRQPSSEVAVKRCVDVGAGMGRTVRIPVEVEHGGAVRIIEDTLRVNQPIDDRVFTLPRDRAKHDLGPYGLDEKTADFFKQRGPFSKRLATAQEDARRNHQRVLLIFGDPDTESSQRFFELREKDWGKQLYEYQQLPIGKTDAVAVEAFRKSYPKLTDLGWPAIVVIDESGEALGSLSLTLSADALALEATKAREFLDRYAFEKPDAERLLADALALAKREDKKVFLQQTGIHCAPCQRLSRFMEEHADVLDRSFVYLTIDAARSLRGPDVIKRLRTDGSIGIPWIGILNADGNVVATQLGFPSTKSNEIEDFVTFLSSNAPRLTAEQLAQMRSDLNRKP